MILPYLQRTKNQAYQYLDILDKWCSENGFNINASKSGVLRVGKLSEGDAPTFLFRGEKLKILEEEYEEKVEGEEETKKIFEPMNYLGIHTVPDASWDKYLNKTKNNATSTISRYWRFFSRAKVSVDIKLRVAKSLVLSRIAYGAEIICLTEAQNKALDQIQAKVLRKILDLPARTSARAVRHILGQTSISDLRRVQRVNNLVRIRNLPEKTQLRKIYDSEEWHKGSMIFGKYEKDEQWLISNSLKTNNPLDDVLKTFDQNKIKAQSKRRYTIQASLRQRETFEKTMEKFLKPSHQVYPTQFGNDRKQKRKFLPGG